MVKPIRDWIRGGSYTKEPSDHNADLYELERQPMFRRRVAGTLYLVVVLILALPIWLIIYAVYMFPDWLDAVKVSWRMIRTGKLA